MRCCANICAHLPYGHTGGDIALFRKFAPFAVLAVLLLAIFYYGWKRPMEVDDFQTSTKSSRRAGYLLLRNFSQELGADTTLITRPLTDEVVDLDNISQYWLIAPNNVEGWQHRFSDSGIRDEEIERLVEWVNDGGTLVTSPGYVNPEETYELLDGLGLEIISIRWETREEGRVRLPLEPVGKSRLIHDVNLVDSYTRFTGKNVGTILRIENVDDADEILLEDEYGSVAVMSPFGKGKVIVFTDQYLFSNFLLSGEGVDNSQFAANILADAGDGTIMFDEFHHGTYKLRGLTDILRTKAGKGIIVLLVVAGLAVYSAGRRFGAIRPAPPPGRRSPAEYAESMGHLFRRARANALALDVIERDLSLFLRERFRLNVLDTSAAREKLKRMNDSDSREIESILDDMDRLKHRRSPSLKALMLLTNRIEQLKGARG